MDGWMERKHSGGRIPRTQTMKPKLRAHDSHRFTVLGQAATGVSPVTWLSVRHGRGWYPGPSWDCPGAPPPCVGAGDLGRSEAR